MDSKKEGCGLLVFRVIPTQQKVPKGGELALVEDGEYKGSVEVIHCENIKRLVGRTMRFFSNKTIVCSSDWVYEVTRGAMYDKSKDWLSLSDGKKTDWMRPLHLESKLHFSIVAHRMVCKLYKPANCKMSRMATLLAKSVARAVCNEPVRIQQHPFMNALYDEEYYTGQLLDRVVARKPLSQEQGGGKHGMGMTMADMRLIHGILMESPWELVFTHPRCKELGIWPIGKDAYCHFFGRCSQEVRNRIDDTTKNAIGVLFSMAKARKKSGHTVFRLEELTVDEDVRKLLLDRAIDVVRCREDATTWVALSYDMANAKRVVNALADIEERAHRLPEPELRGLVVQCELQTLTRDQRAIAQHITRHPVTVVQGGPGTGKTSLLTWVVSHYKNVLATGFVGILVQMLRNRNGGHAEVAHTIDHLIHKHRFQREPVEEWLDRVEVLCIDEISTVSVERIGRVLKLMRNMSKLIVFGDEDQLLPVDPGNPLAALDALYGSQRLTENLRVQPELVFLAQAIGHIRRGHGHEVRFNAKSGPVTWLRATEDSAEQVMARIMMEIVRQSGGRAGPLDVHVLTPRKATRNMLNPVSEECMVRAGIMKRPLQQQDRVCIKYGLDIYVGCKILITQNYNNGCEVTEGFAPPWLEAQLAEPETKKPTKKKQKQKKDSGPKYQSDMVQNGEILLVEAIFLNTGTSGRWIRATNGVESKNIYIHSRNGVSPKHIAPGCVTTVYSSQGREFLYVIFWITAGDLHSFTRSSAYVAVSRTKCRVFVACTYKHYFYQLVAQPNAERDTALRFLLQDETTTTQGAVGHYEPGPLVPAERTRVMEKSEMCSPVMAVIEKK